MNQICKAYTVLDANGNIIRSGFCDPKSFKKQATEPGQRVISGIKEEETQPDVVFHGPQRRVLYPPLEEFVDAYYWSTRGKPELMEAYLQKIDVIKQKIPKNAPI